MAEDFDPFARMRAIDQAMAEIRDAEGRAKRGDFSGVETLITFLADEHWEVVEASAEALGRIGSPQATEALANHAHFVSPATYALEGIGTSVVVSHLITLLKEDDFEFREHGRKALYGILGPAVRDLLDFDELSVQGGPTEHEQVSQWWKDHQGEFDPNVVYAHGEPLDYGRDVANMREFARLDGEFYLAAVDAVSKKLSNATGHQAPSERGKELADHWQDWWSKNSMRFEKGVRYFNGHRVS